MCFDPIIWKSNIPTTNRATGYEEIMPQINKYVLEYNQPITTEQMKEELINKAIRLIRSVNIFPIYYFDEEGIIKEIKTVKAKKDIQVINNELITQCSKGLVLLDYLFPSLHHAFATCDGQSIWDRFYDDERLKRIMKSYFESEDVITDNFRHIFFSRARFFWATPTNFAPLRARAIAEAICPHEGAVIYDSSAGFGGRMLGIMTSKFKYHYICCEPNPQTVASLKILAAYINKVMRFKMPHEQIFQDGSENLCLAPQSVDLCFTCPPFFSLETYDAKGEQQSARRFPRYNEWLEGFVRPTVKNAVIMLKNGGRYSVDLCDSFIGGKPYHLVADWRRICEEEGLIFERSISIGSRARKSATAMEPEQVIVFIKP